MSLKKMILEFMSVFMITLVLAVFVQLIWNFSTHHVWNVDWEMPFTFAVILGFFMTLRKEKETHLDN